MDEMRTSTECESCGRKIVMVDGDIPLCADCLHEYDAELERERESMLAKIEMLGYEAAKEAMAADAYDPDDDYGLTAIDTDAIRDILRAHGDDRADSDWCYGDEGRELVRAFRSGVERAVEEVAE